MPRYVCKGAKLKCPWVPIILVNANPWLTLWQRLAKDNMVAKVKKKAGQKRAT
ncbi:MAG: hypothetical protein LBU89_14865 [Fibromonadaceae bacterium]|jgi:hypothetical protein|nr:hypothetical protein [Fibromonadaceae bacterium]